VSVGNKNAGMELGLAFVKKIGDINIVGSSLNGTHFKLELPQEGMLNGGNYQNKNE
jgi:signal transduction histidine kinase